MKFEENIKIEKLNEEMRRGRRKEEGGRRKEKYQD
jgi:hypothetical protein